MEGTKANHRITNEKQHHGLQSVCISPRLQHQLLLSHLIHWYFSSTEVPVA